MRLFYFLLLFVVNVPFIRASEKNLEVLFDDILLKRFEKTWNGMSDDARITLLSKLGKIAFYMRLYRAWIYTPVGKKGFLDRFPEPKVPVHQDIIEYCTKDLKECVNKIYESIQDRTGFLFPKRDQQMDDFVLDEERFREIVGNEMFAYDVSVSYLMCYLTKNQQPYLRSLPFCSYGFEKGQKSIWLSSAFRDYRSNPLIIDSPYPYDAFDELNDNEPKFTCADESFCPDPCCGRSTNRSTFCSHEICREKDIRRIAIEKGNAENVQHSCQVDPEFNNNFKGLTLNKWNVSCDCTKKGYIFRFDTQKCVDINECDYAGRVISDIPDDSASQCLHGCSDTEECVNFIGGCSCECLPGYYRPKDGGPCVELHIFKKTEWHGAAHAPPKAAVMSDLKLSWVMLCFVLLL